MVRKLTIKIPSRTSPSQAENEPQQHGLRPLKHKPSPSAGSQPRDPTRRRLRDPTDYDDSDYHSSEDSDDEGRLCNRRRRRSSAAKHSMLPSPGEYEAIMEAESRNNPYGVDSEAGLGGSFSHVETKSVHSLSSRSSSSGSLVSQASGSSLTTSSSGAAAPPKKSKNRWAGFWGSRSPSPSAAAAVVVVDKAEGSDIKTTEVEVPRPKWESNEEVLLRLKREEEAARLAFKEDKREALERLQRLGITDSGAKCIDKES
ncbi:hypothetical protein LQW54_000532 [Pestalotiopsis sp. IQ-011]